MVDCAHPEIINVHYQNTFETECERTELKFKLNSIDENECHVADYGLIKKS